MTRHGYLNRCILCVGLPGVLLRRIFLRLLNPGSGCSQAHKMKTISKFENFPERSLT